MKSVLVIWHLSLLLHSSVADFRPPNFKLLLTILSDSPGVFTQDAEKFLEWYAEGGLDKQQVEIRGQEAAAFFKERLGVDFTDIDPAYYTNGTFVGYNGAVIFQFHVRIFPERDPYRIVSAIDDKKSAFFRNARVRDLGWAVTFLADFESTGSLNMTIPAGSQAAFGDYFMLVEKDNKRENFFPKNALDNNNILRFKWKCPEPIFPPATSPMGRKLFIPLECDATNSYYGNGKIRLLIGEFTWARNVISFPV